MPEMLSAKLAALVVWPIASDGDDRYPYIERDDAAYFNGEPGAFKYDDDAAQAVADAINGIVVWVPRFDKPGLRNLYPAVYPDPRK